MKKSTLITTIAMIVVVVVALSTATYAWFSAANATFVETTVSTIADTGVSITAYDILVDSTQVGDTTTYQNTGKVAPTTSAWSVTPGLWSPTNAIATTVNKTASVGSLNSANAITAIPTWYTGTKANTTFTAADAGATNKIDGKMLRIANNTEEDKVVQIFIVVEIGETPTNTQMYTATAVSFYMDNATDDIITTGYNHSAAATETTTPTGTETIAGLTKYGSAVYSNGNLTTSNFVNIGSNGNASATAISGYQAVSFADIGAKIYEQSTQLEDDYALVYGTTAAIELAQGEAINFVSYAWINGWVAEESVKGASVKAYFYVAELTANS